MIKKLISTFTFTKESWNPDTWESGQVNSVRGYCISKKFAEQAAWDFVKENKDTIKFKSTSVNATHVFGPQKFESDVTDTLTNSCEIVNKLIHTPVDTESTLKGI